MRRREFISLLGGSAAAWPLKAGAQAPIPTIGFLSSLSLAATSNWVAAFYSGLKEIGFTEGQNVAVEYRWAEGRYDRLPALAADLLSKKAAVLVATGGPNSGRAAKAATADVAIVFIAGDPVREGLVESLNRPGSNATGVALLQSDIESKRLGLLRDLAPKATMIAVILNPTFGDFESQLQDIQEAARKVGQQIHVLHASNEPEIDAAFANLEHVHAGALLVASDPYLNTLSGRIVTLAAHYAVPAIYETRDFVRAGGLASYGVSIADAYRQVGIYTGRILKGEKPADLPVLRPTKFDLVINLKTAKALGLTVPPGMLAITDEVTE
jgi:putative ABC transport system substrate-binding protein